MTESETKVISNENELKNIFTSKSRNNFYNDQDLKTPGHDKIMDCLIDDAVLSNIINIIDNTNIFNMDDKRKKHEEFLVDKYHLRYIDLHATLSKNFYEKYEATIDRGRILNSCRNIYNENKCSLESDFEIYKKLDICSTPEKCSSFIPYEKIVMGLKEEFKKITGNRCSTKEVTLNIEVKTTIPSIGELIRQINTYRSSNDGYYVVITPTKNINESLINRLNNSDIYLIGTEQLNIII